MRFRKGITAAGVALAVTALGSGTAFATTCGQQSSYGSHSKQDLTSKASITATVSGVAGQTEPTCVTLNGAIDYSSMQGKFTVGTSGPTGNQQSEVVVDGTDVYVQVPQEELAQTNDKPWIKIDAKQESQMLGFDFSMLNSDDSQAPLRSLVQNISYVGKDVARGVPVKHYTATINFAAAAQQATNATQKASLQQLATLYTKPVNVDVWLDQQNRVRKLDFALDLSNINVPNTTSPALSGTVNISVELYDYGTPVNVNVPSASQVATISQAAPGQQPAAA